MPSDNEYDEIGRKTREHYAIAGDSLAAAQRRDLATRREHIATAVLSGLAADSEVKECRQAVRIAVAWADALLDELSKPKG